jgi:uncharacterized protein YaaQ
MAFGVVLFSLLVQGISMKSFINRLGLTQTSQAQIEYENLNARAVMAKTAYQHLQDRYQSGLLSRRIWNILSQPIENQAETLIDAAASTMSLYPDVEARELEAAIEDTLKRERTALRSLLREGSISEETFSDLVYEIDAALTENPADLIQVLRSRTDHKIQELMTVIIQERDLEKFRSALTPLGFPVIHIASTGGFLGRKNATLMIGLPAGKKNEIKEIIKAFNNLEIEPIPGVESSSEVISPAGATIFMLNVERYEEF